MKSKKPGQASVSEKEQARWLEIVFADLLPGSQRPPTRAEAAFGAPKSREISRILVGLRRVRPTNDGRYELTPHGHGFARDHLGASKEAVKKKARGIEVSEAVAGDWLYRMLGKTLPPSRQFSGLLAACFAWPKAGFLERESKLLAMVKAGYLTRISVREFQVTDRGAKAHCTDRVHRDRCREIIASHEPNVHEPLSADQLRDRLQRQKDDLIAARIPELLWFSIANRLARVAQS